MNFRNQECKSYENGSESVYKNRRLIASDQGELDVKMQLIEDRLNELSSLFMFSFIVNIINNK